MECYILLKKLELLPRFKTILIILYIYKYKFIFLYFDYLFVKYV